MTMYTDDWDIEWGDTSRGFGRGAFIDLYGAKCSIQESSLASDCAIWLGIDDPEVKQFGGPGGGWRDVPLPEGASVFGRMHLNRQQVRRLIPILQHFVNTGELDDSHPLVRLAEQAED